MKDTYIMPWGQYKGRKMANVPAKYLIYLWESKKCSGAVKLYIGKNLDVLQEEIKRDEDK